MRGAAAAAVAAMAASGAQAQAPDRFCAELRRVVAAADDAAPFADLQRGGAATPSLGFRYGCGVAGQAPRPAWACHRNLAPEALAATRLAERVRSCLPDARALPGEDGFPGEVRFRLPAAEIRIRESGGPRARAGRIVSLVVTALPPE